MILARIGASHLEPEYLEGDPTRHPPEFLGS